MQSIKLLKFQIFWQITSTSRNTSPQQSTLARETPLTSGKSKFLKYSSNMIHPQICLIPSRSRIRDPESRCFPQKITHMTIPFLYFIIFKCVPNAQRPNKPTSATHARHHQHPDTSLCFFKRQGHDYCDSR